MILKWGVSGFPIWERARTHTRTPSRPLCPIRFNFSQHRRIPRPSAESIRRKALLSFGSQCFISRIQPSSADGSRRASNGRSSIGRCVLIRREGIFRAVLYVDFPVMGPPITSGVPVRVREVYLSTVLPTVGPAGPGDPQQSETPQNWNFLLQATARIQS